MKVFLKDGFDYIPVWNNNVKEEKPAVIHFRFLSGVDFTTVITNDGSTDNAKEWAIICESVENLDINGKKVEPMDIYEMKGLVDLYVELKLAYRNESVFDKKKQ
jgi:hypothetical protein